MRYEGKKKWGENEEKISVRDDTKCIVNFWKTSIKVMSHYSPQDKTHGEKRQDKVSLYKSLILPLLSAGKTTLFVL